MSMQIIDWEEFIGSRETPLALTIGVFDGVHLGHQSLIRRICDSPHLPTVITFRQNPQKNLNPAAFPGDIITLEQKLGIFEVLGVQLAVLIDFSEELSKMSGKGFIDLLLGSERDAHQPVKLIALGRDFRCGHGLDTGAEEIRQLAEARGVEVWVAPPVMDGGQRVSSSRIRQALAEGRQQEAERLLHWPASISPLTLFPIGD